MLPRLLACIDAGRASYRFPAENRDTVKWHLKNLFGKLNAGNRKHLIDRARILGIID